MIVPLRILFLIITLSFITVSCGSDNHASDNTPVITNAPQDNVAREEDDVRTVRFSSVVLEKNCGFWTDCDFIVRSDLNRRPLILTASFVDNGFPTEDEVIDEGQCRFVVTLSEAEADQLEALADRLRICQFENTPTADGGFDGLFMTSSSGKESMVYKFKDRGEEEEGKVNYLCSGRSGFYNYIKKLIVPRAPASCPSGYKRLFK